VVGDVVSTDRHVPHTYLAWSLGHRLMRRPSRATRERWEGCPIWGDGEPFHWGQADGFHGCGPSISGSGETGSSGRSETKAGPPYLAAREGK
jgi:hypothetical protein